MKLIGNSSLNTLTKRLLRNGICGCCCSAIKRIKIIKRGAKTEYIFVRQVGLLVGINIFSAQQVHCKRKRCIVEC